jgi:hypothetical protein
MTSTLPVENLDFENIKGSLKTFLKAQTTFEDYNFEGSGLSVLLDILAYNTHYLGMHGHLIFNETFLKSAQQRGSVVQRASELGYLPNSRKASKALVTVSFTATGSPSTYTIPKWTKFSATSGTESFIFTTDHDCIIEIAGSPGSYTKTLDIIQGFFTEYKYVVNTDDLGQRFIIPSKDVDLTTLSVRVKNSPTDDEYEVYSKIEEFPLGEIGSDTPVYFIEETHDGYFKVFFGDGVFGKAPVNGNEISLSYLVTSGEAANNVRTFALSSALSGVSAMSVVTLENASGGAERESVQSIKMLAPIWYQAQNRAVTEDDYKAIVKKLYPSVDDVTVWGGETNDPPYYGKVFIAIKPRSNIVFSNYIKQQIQRDFLDRYNVMSIRPEIVDPDYIFVSISTSVTYNGRQTFSGSTAELQTTVKNAIQNFMDSQTNKFGQPLYYSKLVKAIDDSSPLILNSVTNLTLEKYEEIIPSTPTQYDFRFNNALHPGSIHSNDFVIDGNTWKIKDRPNGPGPHTSGILVVYRLNQDGSQVTYSANAGSVDYNTGAISITSLKIDSIVGDGFYKRLRMIVSPGSFADMTNPQSVYTDYNVYTNERDQIITLKDASAIVVSLIPDNSV